MGFGRAGAFERGSFSGPGSVKASPLVDRWIWVCRARSHPPQCLRIHYFVPSPTDALINLKVGCRLRRQIPVCWLDLRPVIHLRITAVIPQRWPARRGYVWWLRVDTDVIEDAPDLHALGNERNQTHLPTAHRA